MGDVYGELVERRGVILEVSDQEERRFRETLDRGLKILDQEMAGNEKRRPGARWRSSCMTRLGFRWTSPAWSRRAADGRSDEAGFELAMSEQRQRGDFQGSGESAVDAVYQTVAQKVGPTTFVGYDATRAQHRWSRPWWPVASRSSRSVRNRAGWRWWFRKRPFTVSKGASWATPGRSGLPAAAEPCA